ncbi:hypothetical protein D3C87_1817910 [compost metagenome]
MALHGKGMAFHPSPPSTNATNPHASIPDPQVERTPRSLEALLLLRRYSFVMAAMH